MRAPPHAPAPAGSRPPLLSRQPRQLLDLYFPPPPPPGAAPGAAPVVIFVTGGAWVIGYKVGRGRPAASRVGPRARRPQRTPLRHPHARAGAASPSYPHPVRPGARASRSA
jgi:hypothetical protein